jgi:hypothetical protein
MSLEVAHHEHVAPRSLTVAFGAKRTLVGRPPPAHLLVHALNEMHQSKNCFICNSAPDDPSMWMPRQARRIEGLSWPNCQLRIPNSKWLAIPTYGPMAIPSPTSGPRLPPKSSVKSHVRNKCWNHNTRLFIAGFYQHLPIEQQDPQVFAATSTQRSGRPLSRTARND